MSKRQVHIADGYYLSTSGENFVWKNEFKFYDLNEDIIPQELVGTFDRTQNKIIGTMGQTVPLEESTLTSFVKFFDDIEEARKKNSLWVSKLTESKHESRDIWESLTEQEKLDIDKEIDNDE